VHCVDLGESFPTSIYLQNLASIQPRTSRSKFGPQITLLITYRASCSYTSNLSTARRDLADSNVLPIVCIGAARIVRMRMAFRQNRPWLAHCSCQTSVHDLNFFSQAPLFPSASKILCDALHLPVIMGLREANRSNLFP